MPIQRGSNPVDFQAQELLRGADAQVGGVGNRNAGSATFDFGQRTPQDASAGHSWQLDMLKGLVNGVAPYVQNIANNLNKNAYLEGQVAAAAKKSEDELDANPITGHWQVAGHRDLTNRLRISDAQAQFDNDLPMLATKGPEEMQRYLDSRRETLLPALASSSGQVAEALTGQLALDERTAMAKHAGAHKKYIIDTIVGAQGAIMQNDMASLKRTREEATLNPELGIDGYTKAVESSAGNLVQGIWYNPRLDYPAKVKFTQEAMEYALANDELGYFDYLSNTPIPLQDGTTAPLSSHIPINEWSKMADKRRSVDDRVGMLRNLEGMQQVAMTEAGIKEGTYTGTYDDLTKATRSWLVSKTIDKGQYNNLIEGYMRMKGKQDNSYAITDAYIRGDYDTLYKLGSNPTDAASTTVASFAAKGGKPGIDLPQQLPILMTAGQNGSAGAYKLVGERLLPSLTQMIRPDGTIDAQHAQVFGMVNEHLNSLESGARDAAVTDLLTGLPDSKKDMVLGLRARMKDGANFGQAVTEQLASDKQVAGMTPAMRAAAAVTKQSDITKSLDNYSPMGLWDQAWNGVKSTFGSSVASARSVVAARTSPWSDDQTVAKFNQQARMEIAQEAQALSIVNPGLDGESLVTKAASNVAARTVKTDQGPLFLPKGVSAQKFFGLPESASPHEVAQAVSEVVKPTQDGNRVAFDVAEGKIRFQEYTPDGTRTNHMGTLDPKSVRPVYDKKAQERFRQYDEVHGSGKTFSTGGLPVQFNGFNTAAVAAPWVFDLRKNLVQNEGFRSQTYKDTLGNDTIGVGLTGDYAPKPGPDGKISKEQLDQAFWKASNDAATSGKRVASALGMPQDRNAFLLFSELAYQSGNSFSDLRSYRSFLDTLRTGDKSAAQEAFKSTPAYKASADSRQKHYLKLINNIG